MADLRAEANECAGPHADTAGFVCAALLSTNGVCNCLRRKRIQAILDLVRRAHTEGADWMLDSVRSGLRGYPNEGLDTDVGLEVARIVRGAVEEERNHILGRLGDAERALKGWATPVGGMGGNIAQEDRGRTASGLRAFDEVRAISYAPAAESERAANFVGHAFVGTGDLCAFVLEDHGTSITVCGKPENAHVRARGERAGGGKR